MSKKYNFIAIIIFCCYNYTYGQLCNGNLGDPVIEIDFGSGTATGNALDTSITAFTYSASGELEEGEYTIANTTNGLKGNAWHVTTDHTSNTNGYMMVINSAVLASEGIFYTNTVTGLCANTTYEFSAWLMNIMNPSIGTDEYHPNVTFRISDTSGNILGSYNTGDIIQTTSGTWLQYGLFFTLGNDTEVVITILNSAPSAHPGNDIILDDIAFRPCGPEITNFIDNETTTNITICQNEAANYTFQSIVSSGYSNPQYQWQYSYNFGTTWIDISGEVTTEYTFTDTSISGTFLYRLTVANGSNIDTTACRIASDAFIVEIVEKPDVLTAEQEQFFCTTQAPTLNDIEVSATAVWYDTLIDGNLLTNTTALIDGTTYYAAQDGGNGCESDDRLAILVNIVSPTLVVTNVSSIVCDNLNDESEIIDLTIYNTEITNCNDCIFSYFTSLSDAENYSETGMIPFPSNFDWSSDIPIIYVRIESSDNCYQIAQIAISLEETPYILIPDYIGICEGEDDVTINATHGFDSYLWSTGDTTESISVSTEDIGEYWITVTQDHDTYICSSTKEFSVILSNTAVISNINVTDWTDNNNTITIILSDVSLGNYEYSLDNITYQDNTVFNGITPGEYTVYVRDKNGCGITTQDVYILNPPKYFTPNNDGIHDTWSIQYSITEPDMTIKIFNRYGKLLKFLDATSSWDGTYNGYNLPTSDYWYIVSRSNGKDYTGHFTLKR